jgi:hypothetical protein
MLYLLAIVLGVAAGLGAGGKISNMLDFKIRKAWLIIAALLLQIGAQVALQKGVLIEDVLVVILNIAVYSLLLGAFWYNRHYAGMIIIAAGSIMNALVMTVNAGKMPVSAELLHKLNLMDAASALESGRDIKHVFIDSTTRLPFLADIIHPPSFLSIFMQIVSIGDIVIAAGLLGLLFEIVSGRNKGVKNH